MSLIPLSRLSEKGILYSRNYLDRLIREGNFPAPVYLSPRRRCFVEAEIDAWLAARVNEREAA